MRADSRSCPLPDPLMCFISKLPNFAGLLVSQKPVVGMLVPTGARTRDLDNMPWILQSDMIISDPFIIAIVDDDLCGLEALGSLLESDGYSVLRFGAAQRLLDSTYIAELDCVISDIGMPGMDGIALQSARIDCAPRSLSFSLQDATILVSVLSAGGINGDCF